MDETTQVVVFATTSLIVVSQALSIVLEFENSLNNKQIECQSEKRENCHVVDLSRG